MRNSPLFLLALCATSFAVVPVQFSAGSPAKADDVNKDFTYLDTAKVDRSTVGILNSAVNAKIDATDANNKLGAKVDTLVYNKYVRDQASKSVTDTALTRRVTTVEGAVSNLANRHDSLVRATGGLLDTAKLTKGLATKADAASVLNLSGRQDSLVNAVGKLQGSSIDTSAKRRIDSLAVAAKFADDGLGKRVTTVEGATANQANRQDSLVNAVGKLQGSSIDTSAKRRIDSLAVAAKTSDTTLARRVTSVEGNLAGTIVADGMTLRSQNAIALTGSGQSTYGLSAIYAYPEVGSVDGDHRKGLLIEIPYLANSASDFEINTRGGGHRILKYDGAVDSLFLDKNTSISGSLTAKGKLLASSASITDLRVAGSLVTSPTTPWADYVFEPGYRAMPLKDVEIFAKANGHLPEVPSAAEVQKDGIDLARMNAILLKKIEELTLHAVEQEKRMEALAAKVDALEADRK